MAPEYLISDIYEAALSTERWPGVIDAIANLVGARGGVMFAARAKTSYFAISPALERFFDDYVAGGWMERNERGAPMIEQRRPGFITDTDFHTPDEMLGMSVYRDFLLPRDAAAGAGTVIQGADHDMIALTIEAFASHEAARTAIPMLDGLRPHVARALSVAAQVRRARADGLVEGLGMIGSAAAVIGASGQLRAANPAFYTQISPCLLEHRTRLRFFDRNANATLEGALSRWGRSGTTGASIVVRDKAGLPMHVLHIVPLVHSARDLLESDGLLLLAAGAENRAMPGTDLLRLLFDLTPAEARLARRLGEGSSLMDAAATQGVAYTTARVHLRAIFQKTGVQRQGDLVMLLRRYAGLGSHALTGIDQL